MPRPAASASPEYLLEMHIFRLYPRCAESETLGMGPRESVLTNLLGDSEAGSSLRISVDPCLDDLSKHP